MLRPNTCAVCGWGGISMSTLNQELVCNADIEWNFLYRRVLSFRRRLKSIVQNADQVASWFR